MPERAHASCSRFAARCTPALVGAALVLACGAPAADARPGSAFARPLAVFAAVAADSAAADAAAPVVALGVREDRWQHASLAFAIAAGAGAAGLEPGPAALASVALGAAKELLDARRDRFDLVDLAADIAGAGLAALALAALTR